MPYSSEVLADTPLGYWRLGEAAGTAVMADSSGNGRHGTYDATPVLGAPGLLTADSDTSADFVPTDSASVADANWMDAPSFTVEAWVRADALGGSYRAVVNRDGPANSRGWNLYVLNARLHMLNPAGGQVTGTTPIAINTTYHVALTYDGATARLYLNGALEASVNAVISNNLANKLVIGSSNAGAAGAVNFPWDGRIDEVAFYGAALTAARLAAHHAAGIAVGATVVIGGTATEATTAQPGTVRSDIVVVGGTAGETTTAHPGEVVAPEPVIVVGGTATEETTADPGAVVEGDDVVVVGGTAGEDTTLDPGAVVVVDAGESRTDRNRASARTRIGLGYASWEPPVVEPPALLQLPTAIDVAQAFGPVTMHGTQPSYDVTERRATRQRDRIVVGGRDITFFRGVRTPFPAYQLLEPLMYGPATLKLPQVWAATEQLGVGDLRWCRKGARVLIQRITDAGEVVTDYRGRLLTPDVSGASLTLQVGGELTGPAALRFKPLPIFRSEADLGRLAFNAVKQLGGRFEPRLGPVTGIRLGRFGGSYYLDYLQQLVARAWTLGGRQWTIMPEDTPTGSVYRMRRKDLETIHGTVYLDDARAVGDLRRDPAEEPNRIFATGVTPKGQRVRFGRYPGLVQTPTPPFPSNGPIEPGTTNADTTTGDGILVLIRRLANMGYLDRVDEPGGYDSDVRAAVRALQDDAGLPTTGTVNLATWRALFDLDVTGRTLRWSRIEPAAARPFTRRWRLSASGAVIGRNPAFDRSRLVVDRDVDFGAGFTRPQQREWAKAEIARGEDNWVGTITLHDGAIPRGEHTPGQPINQLLRARAIRPGMNLRLPQFAGGITVHVSGASVADDGRTVTLAVDTQARDAMEIWQVIARNRESRRNPARAWFRDHRASGVIKDALDEWSEVGGLLEEGVPVKGQTWTVFPIVAGQEGTVRSLRIRTAPSAEFALAVFAKRVWPKALQRLVGNPLLPEGRTRWDNEKTRRQLDRDHVLLYAAGDNESPLGYFPRTKTIREWLSVSATASTNTIGLGSHDFTPGTRVTFQAGHAPDGLNVNTTYFVVQPTDSTFKVARTPGGDPLNITGDSEGRLRSLEDAPQATPLTGRWEDDAGFSYHTAAQPVLYVAVWADRDTRIPGGRLMWNQLEAGA